MTISRTVGEKNFAATTVTTEMFINHFDSDHAILFSLPAPVKVNHQAKCKRADKQNNHTTVSNTYDNFRSRKTDALYATGHVIIKVIMMIDTRSIWSETCLLTIGQILLCCPSCGNRQDTIQQQISKHCHTINRNTLR